MYKIIVQNATDTLVIPTITQIRHWANAALEQRITAAELTIRLVDIAEMTALNETYRHKKGPTNVLSFPFDMPQEMADETPIIGDIVICADIVNQESQAQNKTIMAHWAHMVVHGILHLLGYDHADDEDALIMESQEIVILQKLHFANPYEVQELGATNAPPQNS